MEQKHHEIVSGELWAEEQEKPGDSGNPETSNLYYNAETRIDVRLISSAPITPGKKKARDVIPNWLMNEEKEELLKNLEPDFLSEYIRIRDEVIRNIMESTSLLKEPIEKICVILFEDPELCVSIYLINRESALKAIMGRSIVEQISECESVIDYVDQREQAIAEIKTKEDLEKPCEELSQDVEGCKKYRPERDQAIEEIINGTYTIKNIGFEIGEQFCIGIRDMIELF